MAIDSSSSTWRIAVDQRRIEQRERLAGPGVAGPLDPMRRVADVEAGEDGGAGRLDRVDADGRVRGPSGRGRPRSASRRSRGNRRRRRSGRRPAPRARGRSVARGPGRCRAARTGRARKAPRSATIVEAAASTRARSSPVTRPGTEPGAWSIRTTSAPRAAIIRARSTLLPRDMTATNGCPRARQTIARPVPVLPLVSSTTGWPSRSSPVARASRMISSATRSFLLPPGLKYSSFARSRPRSPSRPTSRPSSTSGVPPIVPRIDVQSGGAWLMGGCIRGRSQRGRPSSGDWARMTRASPGALAAGSVRATACQDRQARSSSRASAKP